MSDAWKSRLIGALFVALIIPIGRWMIYPDEHVVPPPSVTTFDQFLDWQPNTILMTSVYDHPNHIMATTYGDDETGGYVFDRTGKMVDWSADYYDDEAFRQKWAIDVLNAMSVDDVKKWLKKTNKP